MSVFVASLVKNLAITLVLNRAFKALGKKEYGDIIGFSGLCLVGIDVINIAKHAIANPPMLFQIIGKFLG